MDLLKCLKALGEENRLRLVTILREGGERPVNELANILGQSQPRVSHHLKVLSDAGIVERYPEGAFVFYRISPSQAGSFALHLLKQYGADCLLPNDRRSLEQQMTLQNTIATAYFDEHADEWDNLREGHIDTQSIQKVILPLIKANAPLERILDIGTGTGDVLLLLAPYIREGEGIDLSKRMLDIARARLSQSSYHHCLVRMADMHRMSYNNNSFDLVIVNMVLHFSDQPEKALHEALRVLKSGGMMILTDFAPHQFESLRSNQSHRRLGFELHELIALAGHQAIEILQAKHLDINTEKYNLPINLWVFKKP